MVAVLDKRKKPLMPCTEKRAKLLLARGRARVHCLFPLFTIRLVDRTASGSAFQPVEVSIDPGSRKTGVAVSSIKGRIRHALFLIELVHRGQLISKTLQQRKGYRRQRRFKLRYRKPGLPNHIKKEGWLAPSLLHRVEAVGNLVTKLCRFLPVTSLAQELVKFDLQQMENPEISGIEYQQGTLAGYEIREYLLEKWGRKCAYCPAENVPLQVEHIHPKANGGTNRISNLCLSCEPCNTRKGTQDIREFLKYKPELLQKILAQAKRPLKDATAVNATRWVLYERLKATGLPVETGSGGRTKFNRNRFGLSKGHALDALCVGDIDDVSGHDKPTIIIKSTGRGSYKRSRTDASGRVISTLTRSKTVKGFQTGDMVIATVPDMLRGKPTAKAGTYKGRVAVRSSGSFNIQTSSGVIQGLNHRFFRICQRADGYHYTTERRTAFPPTPRTGRVTTPKAHVFDMAKSER